MGIGPVSRRKTSLAALWARWGDATRAIPSEAAQAPRPDPKRLTPPLGLAGRQRRIAAPPKSMLQMAPRQPSPKVAAFSGAEVTAGVVNARRKTRTK